MGLQRPGREDRPITTARRGRPFRVWGSAMMGWGGARCSRFSSWTNESGRSSRGRTALNCARYFNRVSENTSPSSVATRLTGKPQNPPPDEQCGDHGFRSGPFPRFASHKGSGREGSGGVTKCGRKDAFVAKITSTNAKKTNWRQSSLQNVCNLPQRMHHALQHKRCFRSQPTAGPSRGSRISSTML